MRVPDLTLTAGNAAVYTHINNLTAHAPTGTTSTGGTAAVEYSGHHNELNKNNDNKWATASNFYTSPTGQFVDHFPPIGHVGHAYSNTTSAAYTHSSSSSTADEFIQRALRSTIATPFELNNSILAAPVYGDYLLRNSQTRNYLEQQQHQKNGSNSNSAYNKGGFQDVYVNGAAIALEKTNRIPTTTTTTTTTNGILDDDANIGWQQDEPHCHGDSIGARSADYQYDYSGDILKDADNPFNELNSNHQHPNDANRANTVEEYIREEGSDCNDQFMLDLCSEEGEQNSSIKQQHNDELDEYLTSPNSSSGVSYSTPQRSYFPRGIINPNYPGFQHLAHTLSEHFIDCTPSESFDDSDMSECEMELSTDSCDDLPDEDEQTDLNVKMNIYNNNSSSSNSNNSHYHQGQRRSIFPKLEFSTIGQQHQEEEGEEEEEEKEQQEQSFTDASNINSAALSNDEICEDYHEKQPQSHQQQQPPQSQHTTNKNNNKLGTLIANELHENLRHLLTLNATDNYSDAYIVNSADNMPFRYDQKCRLVAQIQGDGVGGPTPDILLKNHNKLLTEENSTKQTVNRPDLLRGVSPEPLRKKRVVETVIEENRTNRTPEEPKIAAGVFMHSAVATPVRSSENVKDDVAGYGITPVDIIGDFGEEVEREFGLLVSGYKRLVETNNEEASTNDMEEHAAVAGEPVAIEKVSDAILSSAKDMIDSEKYVNALETSAKAETATTSSVRTMDFMEDNNAVDWSYGRCGDSEEMHASRRIEEETNASKLDDITDDVSTVSNTTNSAQIIHRRPKYQKPSYDERQLPPVAIEYKRCQQQQNSNSNRNMRKSLILNHEKKATEKPTKAVGGGKIARNYAKSTTFNNRLLLTTRRSGGGNVCGDGGEKSADTNINRRRRVEAEMQKYQQWIGGVENKEEISSKSRYVQMSGWAQYVNNDSVKNHGAKYTSNGELASPSALELFDAYKIDGELNKETLQNHLKLAKEIEMKRRSDREEIRRRLAMGAEENNKQSNERQTWKTGVQSRLANAQLGRLSDNASDTESHSSDSETCPKLSKTKPTTTTTNMLKDNASVLSISLADKPTYQQALAGSGGRAGAAAASLNAHGSTMSVPAAHMKLQQQQQSQQNVQNTLAAAIGSNEDMECDFFTKQAKLQIEARMALAQAKEMAHLQMEFERQNRRTSPITEIIRVSLRKIGIQMEAEKRRVSRQMLTDMNLAQLQVLVNSLHTHIEDLNEALVHNLMERDDLHVSQDTMLVDIEELTRYIGANEHLAAQRYTNSTNHK